MGYDRVVYVNDCRTVILAVIHLLFQAMAKITQPKTCISYLHMLHDADPSRLLGYALESIMHSLQRLDYFVERLENRNEDVWPPDIITSRWRRCNATIVSRHPVSQAKANELCHIYIRTERRGVSSLG